MKIVYWSQTGNTERIAELIKKGIEQEGMNAELEQVSSVSVNDIENEKVIILGCPSCGVEALDDTEMEPFIDSLEGKINGKKVALFGSYGWGTGEWMENWEEKMKSFGAKLISEGLMINEEPEDDSKECIDFGKLIAKEAMGE